MSTSEEEIGHLLELPESELYRMIGAERLADSLGATAPSPEEAEEEGRAFFAEARARLRNSVCNHPVVCAYLQNEESQLAVQVIVELTNIVTTAHFGVTPATIAALLFRYGLVHYCHEG